MGNKARIAIPVLSGDYENYGSFVTAAGGQPVFIKDYYESENFDGLLLPGGGDIDPEFYGQPNTASHGIDRQLDKLQLEMAKRFINDKKPILGICRGHQLINVALGGTLVQDIFGKDIHTPEDSEGDKIHHVKVCRNSFISGIYGEEFFVNSSHHQALDQLGEGLEPILLADDGIIEACHHRLLPIYTVQFHPERMSFAHRRNDTIDGSVIIRFFLQKIAKK